MTTSPERSRTVTWSDPAAAARAGRGLSGLEALRAMMAGDLPRPPIVALLGITMASVEAGAVAMRLEPGEHLYNPLGTVHGGAIATILDSVMGCAVQSVLPLGRGYTTLELKVNYLRALTQATGTVTATGRVVHAGRRQAVAEARLVDGAERLIAVATSTCLVFDHPAEGSRP